MRPGGQVALDEHTRRIEADGYTVIDDFLSPADLAEVRRVLALYLGTHTGRTDVEGARTERVYTLVARARVFWRIVLDARVAALCERFLMPGYLLTTSQAIQINPDETPQAFHTDDSFYHLPRPRPMISLSTIVAVDPFTADNGGTEVVPHSHLWSDEQLAGTFAASGVMGEESARRDAELEGRAIPVALPAGGAVVFAGTLLHRGGRNRSGQPRCAFSHQYCQPWARQQENFVLGVPTDVAREMPEKLQGLLGYSVHPPFIGQLTASHPAKALAPGYENRVVAQARAAGARLPE
jgi:ectoine hydroxylase-related dioxygenase (phytanoyl-CoA dioxygenase family)